MGTPATSCAAVAAHGLPRSLHEPRREPLGDSAWAALVLCAGHERVTGLLARAIADGALPATAEQAEEAQSAHRVSMAAALALERTLLRTVKRFAEAGIDYRVLKGPAAAHLDYPDPSLRSFGDIDVLVRSEQFDAAVGLLVRAGHRRRFPEPRPGFDRRFGKGCCLVHPEGHQVDLHRTLAMGPFGLMVRLADLWAPPPSTFRLAGQDLLALGLPERFLHACFHAALGDSVPRLVAVRDVAQMVLCQPLDLTRVRYLASAWKADAVVARAVDLAWGVLGIDREGAGPVASWALSLRPGDRDRRAMAVYLDHGQTYAAKSFAGVRAIGPWRDKAAFLFTMAFPRRRYLKERHEATLRRWRRGVTQVVRSNRRSV
ncbi:MAG: nucleotidyltransferase family protein [Acidimicrobiales bacterium]